MWCCPRTAESFADMAESNAQNKFPQSCSTGKVEDSLSSNLTPRQAVKKATCSNAQELVPEKLVKLHSAQVPMQLGTADSPLQYMYVPGKEQGDIALYTRGCGQCAVPWIMKQKLRQANTLLGGTVEELQFMPFLAQIRYYLEASISSSTNFGQIHFSSSVGPAWVPLKSVSCSGHWVKACLIAWGSVWLSEGGSRRLSWPLPSVWGNIRQNLVALLHRVYIWRLLLFQTGPKSQQPMGRTFLKWQRRNY